MAPHARQRPTVSVVIPFLGDRQEAAEALSRLEAIERRPDDEILFVDNSPAGVTAGLESAPGARVVAATVERSAYAARNEGVELARSDWILFVDADCRPPPTILDDYFDRPIDSSCGAVAGEIVGAPEQQTAAARWTRIHGLLSSSVNRGFPYLPMAPTANLLVRRQAFLDLGGFPEGMTAAAGDVYFSWRLQEYGWRLCFKATAVVEHMHRETIRGLLRQTARDAAGNAWLNRRYPGKLPAPSLVAALARSIAGAVLFAFTGRLERAQMKLIHGLVAIAQAIGYRLGHGATRGGPLPSDGSVVVVSEFPRRGDEFVAHLRGGGPSGRERIEALARANEPDWKSVRGLDVRYWEDDGTLRRLIDTIWLVLRHPGRVIADRRLHGSTASPVSLLTMRQLAPVARRVAAASEMRAAAESEPFTRDVADRLASLSGTTHATGVR
jgi:GT2 family glycosyltransferase